MGASIHHIRSGKMSCFRFRSRIYSSDRQRSRFLDLQVALSSRAVAGDVPEGLLGAANELLRDGEAYVVGKEQADTFAAFLMSLPGWIPGRPWNPVSWKEVDQ